MPGTGDPTRRLRTSSAPMSRRSNALANTAPWRVSGLRLESYKRANRKRPVLDGEGEAHLVTPSCSEPPDRLASWTLSLSADKLEDLKVVESISTEWCANP